MSDELGTVQFNNTVFFLTTNIGQHLALESALDPTSPDGREAVIKELRAFFPQEFLNRVDEFLLFNPLRPEHIHRIVQRDLSVLNQTEGLAAKGLSVHLPDADIRQLIADKYRVEEGARQVQRFIENRMSPHLVPMILKSDGTAGGVITARYAPDANGFEIELTPRGEASGLGQLPDVETVTS